MSPDGGTLHPVSLADPAENIKINICVRTPGPKKSQIQQLIYNGDAEILSRKTWDTLEKTEYAGRLG
ncbi:hypothetical protein RO3G_10013 [Rhizopus delemar RA 99-880]|uniref:Uncharacterized protein n=1 Tax=Rhizopus delemar (strain RA 99-880 / ATCC MYA-4621 / FGSC 9543 / NRRL 43880) TaxID=246409 RepID=I1CA23_RHIO9|nr:hypothetical protein RO3G_10013 [Rhizopus delemar RA 99-880]|eukprot:EIE85303.1 hypothetical protein RO3G_10013 [Rhizopus delemar RA 99-880]